MPAPKGRRGGTTEVPSRRLPACPWVGDSLFGQNGSDEQTEASCRDNGDGTVTDGLPDLAAVAAQLGVDEDASRAALPPPPGSQS
jgi:hypothetical protein